MVIIQGLLDAMLTGFILIMIIKFTGKKNTKYCPLLEKKVPMLVFI